MSVWKKSRNDSPSLSAMIDAGNSSPKYLAFCVTLPGSKVRRTGSRASGLDAGFLPAGVVVVRDVFVHNETPVDIDGPATRSL